MIVIKSEILFLNTHTQNPLGILPGDENKTENMVDIMDVLQQYVPMMEMVKDYPVPSIGRTVQVVTALTHLLPFAMDQKTVVRARGAQKAKINAAFSSRRLAGLVPAVADWHTKVMLLNVSALHILIAQENDSEVPLKVVL